MFVTRRVELYGMKFWESLARCGVQNVISFGSFSIGYYPLVGGKDID